MGIDIYAKWDRMTMREEAEQARGILSVEYGYVGYLREAYHVEPYATKALVPEAFKYGRARIAADTLQARLPMRCMLPKRASAVSMAKPMPTKSSVC